MSIFRWLKMKKGLKYKLNIKIWISYMKIGKICWKKCLESNFNYYNSFKICLKKWDLNIQNLYQKYFERMKDSLGEALGVKIKHSKDVFGQILTSLSYLICVKWSIRIFTKIIKGVKKYGRVINTPKKYWNGQSMLKWSSRYNEPH